MATIIKPLSQSLGTEQRRRDFVTFLRTELAPKPGRLASTLRIVVLTVLTVLICEVYRIPLPAYCAYIVFFVSQEDTASTLLVGVFSILAVTIAIAAAILCYMVSSGEPGLRIPLMAFAAFAGIFVSRTSALGLIAFGAGFVLTIALTMIDVISPMGPLPSTKILTKTILWFWVIVAIPVGLVVIANLLTGRTPADLFRQTLAKSLAGAGRQLTGESKNCTEKSTSCLAVSGTAELLRYHKLASMLRQWSPRRAADNQTLIALVSEIVTLAEEWNSLGVEHPFIRDNAATYGEMLLSASKALKTGKGEAVKLNLPPLNAKLWEVDASAALLLKRLHGLMALLPGLLADQIPSESPDHVEQVNEPKRFRFFVDDAFSNPDHLRFALKVTLAAMIAYVLYNLLDWPNIRTAMITCFFVTLGNVGETLHKMSLRFAGALIGGALGMATVVFLMPYMETIGDLCLVIALVTFLAAWIANGSNLFSYCGMQIAMAYFFCILVGYGPTVDLSMARDRLVGVLLGNGIVFLVFSNIWPVRVAAQVRVSLSSALAKLSEIFLLKDYLARKASSLAAPEVFAFGGAMAQACRLLSFATFEEWAGNRNRLEEPDRDLLDQVQALLGPAFVLGGSGAYLAEAGERGLRVARRANAYHNALSMWVANLAELALPGHQVHTPAPPPDGSLLQNGLHQMETITGDPQFAALANWYRELDRRALLLVQGLASEESKEGPVETGDSGGAL